MMLAGRGRRDSGQPMPADGTFPSGTAAFEKRKSPKVPVWEADLCIQCGQCSFVCPHSVIRARYYHEDALDGAPRRLSSRRPSMRAAIRRHASRLQFYVEDCTGCGLCVEACPAISPREPDIKAINMADKAPLVPAERANIAFFETLPVNDRSRVDFANVRGVQFLRAAVRILRRLRRVRRDALSQAAVATVRRPGADRQCDRLLVDLRRQSAGDALDEEPRGPRPGLVELAVRGQRRVRAGLSPGRRQASRSGPDAAGQARPGRWARISQRTILDAPQIQEFEYPRATHPRRGTEDAAARTERPTARAICCRSSIIWCGGASGSSAATAGLTTSATAAWTTCWRAGAMSTCWCSTPRSIRTPAGRPRRPPRWAQWPSSPPPASASQRKDLALQAIAYGNVYVAQVAMGANPQQTLRRIS